MIEKLIKQINESKFHSAVYIDDDLDMGGAKKLCTIDLDEHRWYTIGTVVFEVGDRFLGVRGPVSLKYESMSFSDLDVYCKAFEMKQVPAITYQKI